MNRLSISYGKSYGSLDTVESGVFSFVAKVNLNEIIIILSFLYTQIRCEILCKLLNYPIHVIQRIYI